MFGRLKALLPPWFGDSNPVLDAMIWGMAQALAWVFSLYLYAQLQTRIKSASDGWLDMIAFDFFGTSLPRGNGMSDASYRNRILINLVRERGTRYAITKVLTDLTGRAPLIFEPRRPADTGAYGATEIVNFAAGPQIYKTTWNGNELQYSTPRTNFLLFSNAFSNAAWAAARWGGAATVVDGDTTYAAPDNSGSSKVVATVGGSGVGQAITLTAGITYTFSAWVLSPAAAANLVIRNSPATTGTVASAAIPASTVFCRYSVTYTPAMTQTYYVGVTDTVALQTYWIFRAQLEIGSTATSNIQTTTAAVTTTDYTQGSNGLITFSSPPAAGTPILWSGSGVGASTGNAVSSSFQQFATADGIATSFSIRNLSMTGLVAYGAAGGYGSLSMPYQALVTAYRSQSQGFPNIAGYGSSTGGYGQGSQADYASLSQLAAVTDADLFAAVDAVRPVATQIWMRISS